MTNRKKLPKSTILNLCKNFIHDEIFCYYRWSIKKGDVDVDESVEDAGKESFRDTTFCQCLIGESLGHHLVSYL